MFDPVSLPDLLGACAKDNLSEGQHPWIVRRKNESERTPGIVSRILMGNGLAVCAAVVCLLLPCKSLLVKHFGKLLTACMRLLKGNVRPWKVPET
jgi:hypothetical protein